MENIERENIPDTEKKTTTNKHTLGRKTQNYKHATTKNHTEKFLVFSFSSCHRYFFLSSRHLFFLECAIVTYTASNEEKVTAFEGFFSLSQVLYLTR